MKSFLILLAILFLLVGLFPSQAMAKKTADDYYNKGVEYQGREDKLLQLECLSFSA